MNAPPPPNNAPAPNNAPPPNNAPAGQSGAAASRVPTRYPDPPSLPAWRPDPDDTTQWRYFDGSRWTSKIRRPGHLPGFGLWMDTSLRAVMARPLTSAILGLVAGGIPATLLGVLIVLRFAETQADAAPILEASGRGLFELGALSVAMLLVWAMGSLGLVHYLHGAQRGRWIDTSTALRVGRSRAFHFFARWIVVGAVLIFVAGIFAVATTQIGRGVAQLLGGDTGLSPTLDWIVTAVFVLVPWAFFLVATTCVVGCVPVAAMIAPPQLSPIRASWQVTRVPWIELSTRMAIVLLVTAAGLGIGWYALQKISFVSPIPASLLNGTWPLWALVGIVATSVASVVATSLLVRVYLDAGAAERPLL